MSGQQDGDKPDKSGEADMAQAFKDLARGEQTASVLENHLTALERKIDELLAKADEDQRASQHRPEINANNSKQTTSGSSDASGS
ncbi:hypothetical protein W97_04143 [Coniosporium apollinis CBS 100218]|uniref:Uncharacterized protein n=1 Tax=Coniosporium apollinis (strain CBS 100218) TaxID=1168221 RepID=R7YSV7_CONA1|nr:uncharacterized protein W97_04143 [Coniosporium apollinis CBS 100218]EON64909.1 hypothetical protein W97_04143 [Coniosporium apollinis CBS 100218]